jgi:predicted small secreted protein
MIRNAKLFTVLLGCSAFLTACNTVQGTMQGASRDMHAVTNSMDQSGASHQHSHTSTANNNPSSNTNYGSTATANSATRSASGTGSSTSTNNSKASITSSNSMDAGNPYSTPSQSIQKNN